MCVAKLTSKPLHYRPVGCDLLACGIRDLEEAVRGIDYAALTIQDFAFIFPLVCTNDLDEAICPVL